MDPNVDMVTETLQQLLTGFLAFLPNLLASLALFFGSLFIARLISRGIKKAMLARRTDPEITQVVDMLARWAIVILGMSAALGQIGFNLTAFLAGVGIVGFTVGFALQDVSKNFVAGLLLLLQQPFELGHTIEVSGYTGTVLKIDLRATEMRTLDGRLVQIPNGDVFTKPIVNFTRANLRRIELSVGVARGTDLKLARQLALEAIIHLDGVLGEPAPKAVLQTAGDKPTTIVLYYWIDTGQVDLLEAQDEGILAINAAFEKAGIEIPYPIHRVYLRQD
jgi:small conductance mechanosensitive channel